MYICFNLSISFNLSSNRTFYVIKQKMAVNSLKKAYFCLIYIKYNTKMHIFRKKLPERFGGMEYSQYFCIRFREHRHGGCLRDSKR